MTSVSTLQDDGRAGAATPITCEATQSGSSGSNLALDNAGNLTIAQWSGTIYTIILHTIANASGDNVQLGDSGHRVHILGNLLVDLAATFTSTLTVGTQLLFSTGSLTRIASFGPYTVTNAGASFNHNLGVIPDMIIVVTDGSARTDLPVVDFSTFSSTIFNAKISAASSTFRGIAIKF